MRVTLGKLAGSARLIGAVAAIGLGWGCAAEPAPNLLLITIDTTRADRLGCYGRGEAATPNLDRLAGEGARFERAIAVAPLTLPSHLSLLTGRYPARHGVRLNWDFRLPESETTLAEHLEQEGYATAAVVGSYVLSGDFGISQGFGTYDEPREDRALAPGGKSLRHLALVERPAAEVTDAALSLLEGGLEEPFFLWLHYFDPHHEYAPPDPFASRFEQSPYDGEIAYVDAELGRLLDAMRAGGRLDRTLVAVTSDHGESLGEHGEATHGLFVYEGALRVPLLLRMPGQVPAGTRSAHLVAGVDLAPTLLDLLGQPPLEEIDGVSFAEVARGGTLPEREAAYSEAELPRRAYGWAALHSLHNGERKFIDAPERELYILHIDPGETRNLAAAAPDEVDMWVQRLEALEASWPASRPEAEQVLDAEGRARLSALGYLSGGSEALERAEPLDPKRLVQIHNLLLDAQMLVARGALPQAHELLSKALKSDPANPAALALDGAVLCSLDRCDLGLELLRVSARAAPDNYQTQRNLGNALHLAGRFAEAAEAYRAAIALHPKSGEDRYALGNVLFAAGDVPGAIASYEEAARLGLDEAPFHAALGVARAAAGDGDGARAALERAVEVDPGLAEAWNQLGILSEKDGRLEEARDLYGRSLQSGSAHAGAWFNHAKVCLRLGQLDAAAEGVETLIREHPDYPAGRYLEAQVRLAQGDEAAARRALEQLIEAKDVDPRLLASARALLERLGG
jgi:arylsulfatase A-like enzyme/Flp pilus assembly protein TadD